MTCSLLILNGPNLNLLGTREPQIYGYETLNDVAQLCHEAADTLGLQIDFRQTNHEGELIDWIHTSVAIRDALTAVALPVVEVHLSNVHQREAFRHHSFVSPIAVGVLCGFGVAGYRMAIEYFAHVFTNKK